MSEDSPDKSSTLDQSNAFAKSPSRSQSAAFVKRSTDNAQIEQNFQSSKLAKERATAQKQMFQECSFVPAIKGLPKSYGPNKTAGTLVYNRLTKWEKNRDVDIKQKKVLRAHEEIKHCTFKPQINKQPKQTGSDKHATTRLYEESALIASNKARLAEELRAKDIEKQTEECTFKPRLSTRRTAWAKVEPKYNQPPDPSHTRNETDTEKENQYSYTPKVNEVGRDMISVSLYLQENVTDRLTRTAKSSPVQKTKPSKERTIIDMATFLSGPVEIDAALKASSREEEDKSTTSVNYYDGNDPHELETNTNKGRPTLSAVERERRKEQFQAFLTRQHAAQERKKIQVQELEKSLFPPPKFEVNEESKKIINQSQKGEFMERLQHDVALRNDRKKELSNRPEECTFKPTLHKSQGSRSTTTRASKNVSRDKDSAASSLKSTRNDNSSEKVAGTNQPLARAKQTEKHQSSGHTDTATTTPKHNDSTRSSQQQHPEHTFKPQLSTSSYKNKKPSRPASNPDIYRQQHEQMLERRKQQQEKFLLDQAALELEECTFAPQIKECPKFVSNIARSLSVVKSVRISNAPAPPEAWK